MSDSADRPERWARLDQIDQLCDEFEAQWRTGDLPRIEDLLERVPEPNRSRLVEELLALELEYRAERGEQPTPEEYRARLPGFENVISDAFAESPTRSPAGTRGSRAGDLGSTSSSLLERVKAHDPDAWRQFVGLYGPAVYRWCRRSGLAEEDARDVGQEVFRAVSRNIDSFRKERPTDRFRSWLRTVARTKIADQIRMTRRQPEAADPLGRSRPAASGLLDRSLQRLALLDEDAERDDSGAVTVLRRALDQIQGGFEERTWQAFWRSAMEAQATAQIAADLGMSVEAVRQAKSRVLRRLKQQLEGLLD